MADITNAGIGPGVIKIATTTYHTQGPPVAGIEADTPMLMPDALSVACDSALTSFTPYVKATLVEISKVIVDIAWGLSATGVLGNPVIKSPIAGVAIEVTWDQLILTLTEALTVDQGEINGDNGAYIKMDVTYKGISSDGVVAAGSVADPV